MNLTNLTRKTAMVFRSCFVGQLARGSTRVLGLGRRCCLELGLRSFVAEQLELHSSDGEPGELGRSSSVAEELELRSSDAEPGELGLSSSGTEPGNETAVLEAEVGSSDRRP